MLVFDVKIDNNPFTVFSALGPTEYTEMLCTSLKDMNIEVDVD